MTLTVVKHCVNETGIVLFTGLSYGANQETAHNAGAPLRAPDWSDITAGR
jgi:hypothetical protein